MNARVKDGRKQVNVLSQQKPHVVAFQDVRATSVRQYEQAFAEIGLRYILHTFQDPSDEATPTGVLIASCFELERLPHLPSSALWPEGMLSPHPEKVMKHWAKRMLFATLQSPWGKIDLYNAYVTPGLHKEGTSAGRKIYSSIKLDLLTGIYHTLATPSDRLRILCGDFNTPQKETITGETITWGQSYSKSKGCYYVRRKEVERHKAEFRVLRGLADYDLSDAYRRVHGYRSEKVYSWRTYRYDHIFASQALVPLSISYLNLLQEHQLSDHVPIEAIFVPKTVPQVAEIV
ncbi:endonuclease/exonuclease/phosphatase family protein [Reticulibacter mediterranei]|uniref:endonuclease/exonuclease/phosphatase family protein n=1 Tax=Reticulibacter mediterranei TaxID=2778369 RepID=UPI003570E5E5